MCENSKNHVKKKVPQEHDSYGTFRISDDLLLTQKILRRLCNDLAEL